MKLLALLCLFAVIIAIPVNVMLPLDLVNSDGSLKNPSNLKSQLQKLKSVNTDGVMTDVWWGIVEYQPGKYNWEGYLDLAEMCEEIGLKLQFVMSFHQCGGNVGDTVNIPIPSFVRSVAHAEGLLYKDHDGHEDEEYLSLSADHQAVFPGANGQKRTAVQMYSDYMSSLAAAFNQYLASGTLNEIEVGMGPAGELRYPGYQQKYWSYPGIGEFQCFDKYLLADFVTAAKAAGHPEWNSPPNDAGNYNSWPSSTSFFQGGYTSTYGRFFQTWYSDRLVGHGRDVLKVAKAAFSNAPNSLVVSGKVSGIHWWYGDASHAAEMTTGYYNTDGHDTYLDISKMMADLGCDLIFTCLEMRDGDNNPPYSRPYSLVEQVEYDAKKAGIAFSGENALPINSWYQYQTVLSQVNNKTKSRSFTMLRLGDDLLNDGQKWGWFQQFLNQMHSI
ncbi:Glycoside hydrolase family 14 [Carpediemonas membranifera]|uniref:Beta-amylase n=1 Tax=Carpediemonas membranifera TaxID=201153 RepID=A0A8J6BDQ4_9EUKA|nr:Glycoside hydrolase family 14 [Carpediemonas membranifera]|eukprot:KAG9395352.1 Glycoside hydrolase family 14 [Carpediemonas membranifera]